MSDITGIVLYSDGSFRHSNAGWGIHGYTFGEGELDKTFKGFGDQVTGPEGYVPKADAKKRPAITVKPVNMIYAMGGIETNPTNNHGEMMGVYKALEYLLHKGANLESAIILTDSKYVIDGLTKYVKKWRTNMWRTAQGDPVANRQLWEQLDLLFQKVEATVPNFRLKWVKGHEGNAGNELSDLMARLGSGQYNRPVNWTEVPFDEWVETAKPETFFPLLIRGKCLFAIGDGLEDGLKDGKYEYRSYHLGGNKKTKSDDTWLEKIQKSEVLLGHWLSQQIFSFLITDEPIDHVERMRSLHAEHYAGDIAELAVVHMDNCYNKKFYRLWQLLKEQAVVKYPRDKLIMTAGDEMVSRTLNPPLRALDALKEFDRIERHLKSYLGGFDKDGNYTESVENRVVVDLTELLFAATKKSAKAKEVWKSTEMIDKCGGAFPFEFDLFGMRPKIKFVLGLDLPSRNALAAIAGPDTKAVLLAYKVNGMLQYEIVITTPTAKAIYSSPQLQYIL